MATAVDTTVRPASTPPPPDRFRTFTGVVSWAAPAALIVIVTILFQQAWPAVTHYGLGFLTGIDWNPVALTFGALPAVFGTVTTSAIAITIALPVGVAVALFLVEPGQQGVCGASVTRV